MAAGPSHKISRLALAAVLAILPLGCAVGPDFKRPTPALPADWAKSSTSPAAHNVGTVNTGTPQLAAWWAEFNDPTLSSLIERARESNLDVRAAVLRITEARAGRDVSAAGLWPTLSADASYTRERLSESTPTGSLFTRFNTITIPGAPAVHVPNPYDQYQVGLGASWEIDLFGRVRRSLEAANADWQASVEDQYCVLVSLDSDVAHAYIDLRGAQLRKSVAQASLATQRELLDLTRQRQAAGLTTDVDVENAAAQVSVTQAQLPLLDLQITQDIHQLGKLLDLEPEALRGELDGARAVPPVPPQVPIGLPADLARRRPDIRAAEQNLHAATARIGVAVADLFPRLTLSAAGGFQAQSTSTLLDWASRFGTLGPGLELPVLDRGRWATVHVQDIRAQEAAVAYERVVLGALHEVENSLAAYRADQDRQGELNAAVAHSRDALTLARERYESGVANFIVVLDAERTVQQNEEALAESVTGVSADLVALYRALGGSLAGHTDHG
ncbi:MAG: efflux transporter outer membrane subunit [Steroidobacteraceae bacterium]